MPDEQKDKRPWWVITQVQGLGIMLVGVGLMCFPPTAPAGMPFVTVGSGWFLGGVNARESRKKFNGQP